MKRDALSEFPLLLMGFDHATVPLLCASPLNPTPHILGSSLTFHVKRNV